MDEHEMDKIHRDNNNCLEWRVESSACSRAETREMNIIFFVQGLENLRRSKTKGGSDNNDHIIIGKQSLKPVHREYVNNTNSIHISISMKKNKTSREFSF